MPRTRIRMRNISAAGVLAILAALASLLSPWSISIPPAHLAQSFGFQTPACWVAVLAIVAAVVLEERYAMSAVALLAIVVFGWFAWAMWVVTTPNFTDLPFPFVGTDVIGPGWYPAAISLLLVTGSVVKELTDHHAPVGKELWALAALPGFGLMRLHRWGRGLAFATLVSGAIYFASTDSPDATQFADYGASGNVPPSFPRGPEWVLLAVAAALWATSIAATIVERRRQRVG